MYVYIQYSFAISNDLFVLYSKLLASFLNSYELVLPPDGEYGRDIGNGSWTGVVGMMQNKVRHLSFNFSSLAVISQS